VSIGEPHARALEHELGELLTLITETPAPTFQEAQRGELVSSLLAASGLAPHTDEVGNVIAEVPGGAGPRVLLAAHLDTVFPMETDVTVRKEGNSWSAPGIGDNSASLAVLLTLLKHRGEFEGRLPRITFVATVGEEGTGDLRGVRHLFAADERACDYFIAVDGHLGAVVDAAVGSKRFEFRLSAPGGHSWGDFPSPSAVHGAAAAMTSLLDLNPPRTPRSTFNVGQVWGGTGVNAIAQSAGFNLDLRSEDPETLESLEREALARIRRSASRMGCELEVVKLGDRPAARPLNRTLTRLALATLEEKGVAAGARASSTDANIPLSLGVPSISFGVYRGWDAHRLSEGLYLDSLPLGYELLVNLLARVRALEPAG